jgi:hypothetical protein
LSRTLAARGLPVTVNGIGFMLPASAEQSAVGDAIRQSGLTPTQVSADLDTAAHHSGFRSAAFAPFIESLPTMLDPATRVTYDGLIEHGLGPVVSRFVTRRNGRYEAVTYLYPRSPVDVDALGRAVRESDPGLRLSGLSVINQDVRRQFLPQFATAIALGTAAVAALIFVVFKSVGHSLLAMLPTAVGFIWSAGILGLARVELDLFSVFAAIIFIGVAVDYGIHVLHRYMIERAGTMEVVLADTGFAILVACLTTVAGFGSLMLSNYAPLRLFGLVSVITLSCHLVASVVFLPALVLQGERWSRSAR